MTIVLNLTWWGVTEFALWILAGAFGAFLLSRCYVAFRDYGYRKQRQQR